MQDSYAQSNQVFYDERQRLAEERAAAIESIKTQSAIDEKTQRDTQSKDYASRSTSLVTSGGGFLGATQSQEGVLQNLKATFDQEHSALITNRDAAIAAANSAYNDKDFAVAKELASNAKDLQNEIYKRQTDFADQQLKIASANRAQSEYDLGITDKKIQAYATMDDATFKKQDPADIAAADAAYYPGYTNQLRQTNQKVLQGKTLQEDVNLKKDIQTLINETPIGQTIKLADGSTYKGLKKPPAAPGAKSGTISNGVAFQLGVPSLAGKDESDVILSLSLNNAPDWYIQYYKNSAPDVFKNLTKSQLNEDWGIFKQQPDIQAYANSAAVTKRINKVDDTSSSLY